MFVARAGERQCWWWRDAFYWESGDYEPEDMYALLTLVDGEALSPGDSEAHAGAHNGNGHAGAHNGNGHADAHNGNGRADGRNENGHVCLEQELELRFAEPIRDEVKRLVFERDDGRCVQCGSADLIQFDHILSFLQGGGNDPDNLRLLCAECNRRQASLVGWASRN